MGSEATRIERTDFVWALGAMCRSHKRPFDADLLAGRIAPPYTPDTLLDAARALGFRAGACAARAIDLGKLSVPFLALLAPRTDSAGGKGVCVGMVLGAGDGKIELLEPAHPNPRSLALDDFAATFAGTAIQFVPEAPKSAAPDGAGDAPKAFGFSWFVPELLRHRAIWRDVLLASLAIQVLALGTPLVTQIVIDKVVVHQSVNTLIVAAVALALIMVFSSVMSWTRQYLVLHTGNRVDAALALRVFGHLLELPARYFEQRPTGTLVARLYGVETIREFVSGAAVVLALDVPFLLVYLAVMLYYSWQLSMIALAILALIVAISFAVVPFIRARVNRQFLLGARNQAFLTEYIAGIETVKSLQMEPVLKNRFGEYLGEYLEASFHTRQLSNTYNVVAGLLEQLMTLLVLCVGAWLVMQNEGFSIGMLVAFQMFAARLSQPMLRMAGLWQEFQQAAIAVRRLGDLMDAPAETYSLAPMRAGAGRADIEVESLSFRHAEDLPYLYRNFDLRVAPGACVLLTGASGSGKSTLAKLMLGFYRPTEGSIKLNGHDIRNLTANELRMSFGVVPQETRLFSGSVYDNLVLANPHTEFGDVVRACGFAGIHEFIDRLPQGYQTRIGEQGVGLSGGQKQRLAIARALLKRPQVLIFDEATSSLDAETAEQFAATVNALRGKVSVLFISHQPPRALAFDAVVRLGKSNPGEGGAT